MVWIYNSHISGGHENTYYINPEGVGIWVIRILQYMFCRNNHMKTANVSENKVSEWVSEWLNSTAFLGTAGSEVHIVHISHVIIAYTLES